MQHHPATAHESAATIVNPSWSAILVMGLLTVLVPVVGMVLVTHPMLAVGVVAGLVGRRILRAGRHLGRRLHQRIHAARNPRWVEPTNAISRAYQE